MTAGVPEKRLWLRGFAALRTPAGLSALAIMAGVLAFAVIALRVGLRFPVPWPDEGSFLWPALSFRDRLDLYAPEVNPEREVLWMPPGFMVMHGLIFSVFTFTLERARFVSTVLVAVAVLSVFSMVSKLRASAVHALTLVAFLAAPIVFVVGNCARMESLVLALVTSGFLLLSRGRAAGLALVAVAPLAHPNGLFAFAGAFAYAAYLFVKGRGGNAGSGAPRLHFGRVDIALLVAAVLCWLAYGVHVLSNFDAFKADMEAQLRFKVFVSYGEDGFYGRILKWPIALGLVSLVAGGVLGRRMGAPISSVVFLSGSFFVQTAVAAGWLYEVYPAFALTLATITLVESVWIAFERRLAGPALVAARVGLGLAAVACILLAGRGSFLMRSLEKATVERDTLSPDYLTLDDRRHVRAAIRQIARERGRATVQFVPAGEGLAYESLRGPNIAIVEQTFYVSKFDVLVVHDSVWCAKLIHDLELLRFLHIAPQPVSKPETFHSRDGTERWHVYTMGVRPVPGPPPRWRR